MSRHNPRKGPQGYYTPFELTLGDLLTPRSMSRSGSLPPCPILENCKNGGNQIWGVAFAMGGSGAPLHTRTAAYPPRSISAKGGIGHVVRPLGARGRFALCTIFCRLQWSRAPNEDRTPNIDATFPRGTHHATWYIAV